MAVIKLAGTDISWSCLENDTIMRSALRAGLGFPYECNVGSCGNCRFDLLEGEVLHLRADPPGLRERDRQRGRRLGCQARPLSDCTVKLRLLPQYQSRFVPRRQSAVLVGTRAITHDIREFQFKTDRPAEFLPGQYALLELPEVAGSRAYSMANIENAAGEWHFQIRRVPDGLATDRLFERCSPGSAIILDGPYGMAYLRDEVDRDIVCLAGGSGLSPMISIARGAALAPTLAKRRLDFFYGGRRAVDICGKELLEELPGFGKTIHFHPVVSDGSEADDGWGGYRGFVHEIAYGLFADRLANREIYFAGPQMMAEAIQKMLLDLAVPAEQIHFDQFY
jgi:toluene monooxygenase electron transfer component